MEIGKEKLKLSRFLIDGEEYHSLGKKISSFNITISGPLAIDCFKRAINEYDKYIDIYPYDPKVYISKKATLEEIQKIKNEDEIEKQILVSNAMSIVATLVSSVAFHLHNRKNLPIREELPIAIKGIVVGKEITNSLIIQCTQRLCSAIVFYLEKEEEKQMNSWNYYDYCLTLTYLGMIDKSADVYKKLLSSEPLANYVDNILSSKPIK